MRDTPTLRAHPNVIDLAEERRAREQPVRVTFPGFASVRLTPYEIEARRRKAKENSAYARKVFARLEPIPEAE